MLILDQRCMMYCRRTSRGAERYTGIRRDGTLPSGDRLSNLLAWVSGWVAKRGRTFRVMPPVLLLGRPLEMRSVVEREYCRLPG